MSIGVVSKRRRCDRPCGGGRFAQNRNFAKTKSSTSVGRHSAARAVSGLALAAIHRRLNLHACETAAKRSPLGWILGEGYYLKKSGYLGQLEPGFSLPEALPLHRRRQAKLRTGTY